MDLDSLISDEKLYLGLMLIPLGWVILYSLFDKYADIYRYSRLSTLRRTFLLTFIGSGFLFFTVMMDDLTRDYLPLIIPVLVFFTVHFLVTSFFRMVVLTWAKMRLNSGQVHYRVMLVGDAESVKRLWGLISTENLIGYNKIVGYVSDSFVSHSELPLGHLGKLSELRDVVSHHGIEEVIVGGESESDRIWNLFNDLYELRHKILVKCEKSLYEILIGHMKLSLIDDGRFLAIDQDLMTRPMAFLKRSLDVFAALVLIMVSLPINFLVAIGVWFSSKGPLLYSQERIGKDGIPFYIYKFRSMYVDAEKTGPQLSKDFDPRITPFGRFIRKWRLDETPQFFNLLVGDMSLVGPGRPERLFYIDQILNKKPVYNRLLRVRPGITSLGQVKYGYASDLNQMLERLQYDLSYLERMSFSLDIKILFQTALILVQGRGK